MKLIKEGIWTKRLTCRGCKAVMEVSAEDVRYGMYSQDYETVFSGNFYVECPSCTKKIILKDMPERIGAEIKENRSD